MMVVVPIATPVICGFCEPSLNPAGMNTLGVIVAAAVLLLVKVTVTPPGGAITPRLSASCDV